ncbi:hypothetical protein E2C06_16050 [Dankookia rubra]|uniref:Uncharacterized protein n=1 Tax=Dankookia rubra TaxID=1442381 RepID=A0A4R5QG01_9PROT|nr:hypothetical protein [Dankookia rubra]TDH61639.1 hypothetical protein E2C06_16050 [Dankookia rubra]
MNLSTGELREFFARCAKARQRFQELAVQAVPRTKLMEHAERLGIAVADEMAQPSEEELAFAFDLAIYTAPPGRSRAIDRLAKQHARLPGEAALVLNGLSRSWFSVFAVQRLHPEAGFILEDALLGGEVWVVDELLAEQAEPGTVLATRLARISGFAITCGVVSVLDEAMLARLRQVVSGGEVDALDLVEAPRFAQNMWLHALGSRVG